jgi:hypothetical protein
MIDSEHQRLSAAAEYFEVQNVLIRYSIALDIGDHDGLDEVFAADSELGYGEFRGKLTPAEFTASLRNHRCRATTRTYVQAQHVPLSLTPGTCDSLYAR